MDEKVAEDMEAILTACDRQMQTDSTVHMDLHFWKWNMEYSIEQDERK